MIQKMAKPEEVIVVENEQGEAVRETMKDTDAMILYKSMRETLGQLHWMPNTCTVKPVVQRSLVTCMNLALGYGPKFSYTYICMNDILGHPWKIRTLLVGGPQGVHIIQVPLNILIFIVFSHA